MRKSAHLVIVVTLLFFTNLTFAQIKYVNVNASGAGDGTSWTDAYTELRDALAAATSGDTIVVAAGTYKPTATTSRSISFEMITGVKIFGGFAGTEATIDQTTLDARDFETNATILNGDIQSNTDLNDYSEHVVEAASVDSTGVLDGFTITRGNANSSTGGGGIYVNGGNPTLKNLVLYNNYSAGGGGAAINIAGAGNMEMGNILIYDNRMLSSGAAMTIVDSSPLIYNMTITNTTSLVSSATAKGLENENSSTSFINCISWDNEDGDFEVGGTDLPVISYSLLKGTGGSGTNWNDALGTDGGNNPAGFPLLADISTGDHRLLEGSAALNAGNATYGDNIGWYQGEAIPGNAMIVSNSLLSFGEVTTDTSAEMSFTVSGVDLSSDISMSVSNSAFLLSTTSGDYSGNTSTISLQETAGVVNETTIYTIYVPTSNGDDNGTITFISTDAPTLKTTITATAVLPDISISDTGYDFGVMDFGTASAEQSYTVSAVNLTDDLVITAPEGFEISLTSGDYSGNTSVITLTPSSGTVSSTTIYVRFNPDTKGRYTGEITHESSGADNPSYDVEGVAIDPAIIYVDAAATGSNSGESWTNAYTSLDEAMAIAIQGDTVVVAKGTYVANQADSTVALTVGNGVTVFGGFAGNEVIDATAIANRDFETNETIITGYRGGDESMNSKRLLYLDDCDDLTTIDGFTLTKALRSSGSGAAIYVISSASVAFRNLIIKDNRAYSGAGIYVLSSNGTIENVVFRDNEATGNIDGGAAFTGVSSTFDLIDCQFINNFSEDEGGAIHLSNCNVDMTNCRFLDNFTENEGGAIYASSAGNLTISKSIFKRNKVTATGGLGGAIRYAANDLTLDSCEFIANEAMSFSGRGGAIYMSGTESPEISNSLFCRNFAKADGGAIYTSESTSTSTSEQLYLTNNTFAQNRCEGSGPAVYNFRSNVNYVNTIVWGNEGGTHQHHNFDVNSTADYQFSLIENSMPNDLWEDDLGTDSGNNIDTDPLFVDLFTCNVNLQSGSPALGAGNSTNGNNIGYYQGTGTDALSIHFDGIYVKQDATGNGDGSSWTDAYTSLQEALEVSTFGTRIFVAKGVYTPSDTAREVSFEMLDGVRVYGGFAGDESTINAETLQDRDFITNETILSGDLQGDDASVGTTDNSYHVVVANGSEHEISSDAVLDGFTISSGNANGDPNEHQYSSRGGGVFIYAGAFDGTSSPTLNNLVIKDNYATIWGGGMVIAAIATDATADPILNNIQFLNNSSGQDGGGLHVEGVVGNARPQINQTTFIDNSSDQGGGVKVYGGCNGNADPVFRDVFFCGNSGGGLEVIALDAGGACDNIGGFSRPTLINVTFAEEEMTNAAYLGTVEVEIQNSIIWGTVSNINGAAPTYYNSIIKNSGGSSNWSTSLGVDGGGNLDDDPLFADLFSCDTSLVTGSPAIGAGDPTYGSNIGYYQGGGITAPAVIGILGSIADFGTVTVGTNSEEQLYQVFGTNLTGDIAIVPPSGFEISLTSGTGFSGETMVLQQSGGSVDTTTIYIRFSPAAIADFNDVVSHTSDGAVTREIEVSGSGAAEPSVNITPGTIDFGFVIVGESSPEQALEVSATDLRGDLTLIAPNGFEITTTSGSGYSSSLALTPDEAGSVSATEVFIVYSPIDEEDRTDSLQVVVEGLSDVYVYLSGEARYPSLQVDDSSLTTFGEVVVGEESAIQSYRLVGIGLTETLSITTSSNNFVITLDTTAGFSTEILNVDIGNGNIDTTVYVKFTPQIDGFVQEFITHSSGQFNEEVLVTGDGRVLDPSIIITSSLDFFGEVTVDDESGVQSYTVAGADLSDNLVISPSIGYYVSLSETEGFVNDPPLELTPVDGVVAETTIYIKFIPDEEGPFDGVITHSSTGADAEFLSVSGFGLQVVGAADHLADELIISPNPASNTLSISEGMQGVSIRKIEIYNALGQKVVTIQNQGLSGQMTFALPLGLDNGLYHLLIETVEYGMMKRKFQIRR